MVEVAQARTLTSEILSLGKETDTSLPAYGAAVKHLEVVESHAGSEGDITGLYGAVRVKSGLNYYLDSEEKCNGRP